MHKDRSALTNKLMVFFGGLLLSLVSIAMILNYGYVARTVTFPFTYLFGILSYLIYIFLYIEGMFLVFSGHWIKFKKKILFIPIFLALVSLSMLITWIVTDSNPIDLDFANTYWNNFKNIDPSYYDCKFINLFGGKFGGGILGYSLIGALNVGVGQGGSLAISIACLVVFTVISFSPLLVKGYRFLSKQDDKAGKRSLFKFKKREEKRAAKKQAKEEKKLRDKRLKDEEIATNVFLHADEVGENEVGPLNKISDVEKSVFDGTFEEEVVQEEKVNIDSSVFEKDVMEVGTVAPARFAPISNEVEVEKPSPIKVEEPPMFNDDDEVVGNEVNKETNEVSEELTDEAIVEESPNESETSFSEDIPFPTVEEVPNEMPKEEVKQEPIVEEAKEKERIVWVPPSSDMLNTYQTEDATNKNIELADQRKIIINQVFEDFKIAANCMDYTIGPSITRFHIDYTSTGLIKSVANMTQDISRKLCGANVRFEPTVEGCSYSGLEVPNAVSTIVSFKEVFDDLPDVTKHPTAIAFGKDIAGKTIYADFNEFPHLLVSGTTGSGKSVFVNSIITTLIMRLSPEDFKIVLVDPKRVEMTKYKDIPHLLCPVINEANQVKVMLNKLVKLMEERYKMFTDAEWPTNLKEYNEYCDEKGLPHVPYILVVLDEYGDLVYNCKDIALPTVALAQKARAAGIHLLIATQRPTTDVITGTIKANLNTRVSLSAASVNDSVVIVDEGGAEKLLGNGDMLVKSPLVSRVGLVRLQGCLIKTKEIVQVVSYLKEHYKTDYDPNFMDLEEHNEPSNVITMEGPSINSEDSDEAKYQSIKGWASTQEYVSMSKIQRECGVGFNRAGRIVKRLQDEGVLATTSEQPSRGFKVINGEDRFYESDPFPTSEELKTKDED